MEHVVVASPDRRRYVRIGREVHRMGWGVVRVTEAAGMKTVLADDRIHRLVLDAGIDRPSRTLVLVRWIRRRHRQVGVILVGAAIGRGLESSCSRLDVPCLREPIQGALLRSAIRGALGLDEIAAGKSGRPPRKRESIEDQEPREASHDVDDLWFEILDRASRRARRRNG